MRVVHRSVVGHRSAETDRAPAIDDGDTDGDAGRVLASNVRVVDSIFGKARGLMFRRSFPDWGGLVFPFDRTVTRSVHMLFVPFPIDVLFLIDGRAERVDRLSGWTGLARARADTIVELPAGRASDVEPGDRVVLEPPTGPT